MGHTAIPLCILILLVGDNYFNRQEPNVKSRNNVCSLEDGLKTGAGQMGIFNLAFASYTALPLTGDSRRDFLHMGCIVYISSV